MNSAICLLLLFAGPALAAPQTRPNNNNNNNNQNLNAIKGSSSSSQCSGQDSWNSEKLTTTDQPQIVSLSSSRNGNVYVGLQKGLLLSLTEELKEQDRVQAQGGETVDYIDSDEYDVVTATANKVSLYSQGPKGSFSKSLKKKAEATVDSKVQSVRLLPTLVIIGGVDEARILNRSDLSHIATIQNPGSGSIKQHQIAGYGYNYILMQAGKGRLRVYEISRGSNPHSLKLTQTLNLPKKNEAVSAFAIYTGDSADKPVNLAVGYKSSGIQILKASTPFTVGAGATEVYFDMVSELQNTTMHPEHVSIVEDDVSNEKLLIVDAETGTSVYATDERNQLNQDRSIHLSKTGGGQYSLTPRAVYYLDDDSKQVSAKSVDYLKRQLITRNKPRTPKAWNSETLTSNNYPKISTLTVSNRKVFVGLQEGLLLRLNESLDVQERKESQETVKYLDSDLYDLLVATQRKISLYTHYNSNELKKTLERTLNFDIKSARLFPTFIVIGGVNEALVLNRTGLSDIGTIKNPGSGNIEQHQISSYGYNYGVILQGGNGKLRVYERPEQTSTKPQNYRVKQTLNLPDQDELVSTFAIYNATSDPQRVYIALGYKNSGLQIVKSSTPTVIGEGPADQFMQLVSEIQNRTLQPSHVEVVEDRINSNNLLIVAGEKGSSVYTIDENNKLNKDRRIDLGSTGQPGQFSTNSRACFILDGAVNQVSARSLDSLKKELNTKPNVDNNTLNPVN